MTGWYSVGNSEFFKLIAFSYLRAKMEAFLETKNLSLPIVNKEKDQTIFEFFVLEDSTLF